MKKYIVCLALFVASTLTLAAESQDSMSSADHTLIQSAFDGNLKGVQAALKKGASIDATGPKKRTALIWASANGHLVVAEFLLSEGADINARDSDGQTGLIHATRKTQVPVVRYLLDRGAEVNVQSNKRGVTALSIAAANGNAELVGLLVAHGADPLIVEQSNRSALTRGRESGNPEVIAILEAALPPVTEQ